MRSARRRLAVVFTSILLAPIAPPHRPVDARPNDVLLLTGRVVDEADGSFHPSDAVVTVFADVGSGSLADVASSADVEMLPVSTTKVASDGSFRASLPGQHLPLAVRPQGQQLVDFTAIAVEGFRQAVFTFTRLVDGDGRVLPDGPPSSEVADADPIETDDLTGGVATTTDEVVMQLIDSPTTVDLDQPVVASDVPPVASCQYSSDAGRHWVLVGSVYHAQRGTETRFRYRLGAHTTMGAGWSVSGRFGSWRAGGTNTRATTDVTSYPMVNGWADRFYYTGWRYGTFFCTYADPLGNPVVHHYWLVKPVQWVGGATWATPASTPRTRLEDCTFPYRRGTHRNQTTTTATTWRDGVNVSSVIGIDLSSRTGYSAQAGLSFTFNRNGMRLCGVTGVPGDGSGEAPAGS